VSTFFSHAGNGDAVYDLSSYQVPVPITGIPTGQTDPRSATLGLRHTVPVPAAWDCSDSQS
jgi:hypothetical protein